MCSSHAITQDINLTETAKAAEFFLSDGIIVTGTATGEATEPDEVNRNYSLIINFLICYLNKFIFVTFCVEVKYSVNIPVLVGSGVTKSNVHQYKDIDGLIIGSYFKKNGRHVLF